MVTNSPSVTTTDCPYTKTAGYEPLPGYRIIEPLGRGGFGEVWLCEAPGGLHKAIKFVPRDRDGSGSQSLKQEFEAFQTIKSIRHPFLLTLERVELQESDLVMVMELADAHLQDRQIECQAQGLAGIPRSELLGYLLDGAEALDHISQRYGLQHLDVKPANLFLLSGHVKVGDYGLVARLTGGAGPTLNRGLTPKYVAPEVLRGQIHPASDQYSLALVYHELLTGQFPFTARSPQQMMLAHVSSVPNLVALPTADQAIVAKALAKNPDDRFASCIEFLQSLITAVDQSESDTLPPHATRFMLPQRFDREQPTDRMIAPTDEAVLTTIPAQGSGSQTVPTPRVESLPALRTVSTPGAQPSPSSGTFGIPPQRPNVPRTSPPAPPEPKRPARQTTHYEPEPVQLEATPTTHGVKLPAIRSVVTAAALQGFDAPPPVVWADQIVDAVLAQASGGGIAPKMPGEIGRRTNGTWFFRFPTTLACSMVRLKCEPMIESRWFDEITQPEKNRIVMKQFVQSGGLWSRFASKKPSGLEIELNWPISRGCGEVELLGRLFGTPDSAFVRDSLDVIPKLMVEIQRVLQNVEDRRKSQRIPTTQPIKLYPVADDGTIQPMVSGQLRDISTGGLACVTKGQPTSRYCYANFEGCGIADGLAVLVRLLRVNFNGQEYAVSGKFRTDL